MNDLIPETMKAIEILDPGKEGRLSLTDRIVPKPEEEEVLIKVIAAGINRPDIVQKQGRYNPPQGTTDIPGLEVSGEVVALGEGVTGIKRGDKVCALLTGGGYAEYCTAPVGQCLPVPAGISMIEAAAIPETFFTVWDNLFERAGLEEGESVLIHGGSSGIGTTAIQLAKSFGAKVYVTAGTEEKCRACEDLGADLAINYKTRDFVEEINKETQESGVNVILDMVGGDYLSRNLSILSSNGWHISIAMLRGNKAEIDIFQVMRKQLVLTGSTLRARPVEEKAELASLLYKQVWPLLEKEQVKPIIFETYPLEKAQSAQELMEESKHIGKIVLVI